MPFKFKSALVEPDPEQVERFHQALDHFNRLLDEAEDATEGLPATFSRQAIEVIEDAKNKLLAVEPKVTKAHKVDAENNEAVAELEKRINTALEAAEEFTGPSLT